MRRLSSLALAVVLSIGASSLASAQDSGTAGSSGTGLSPTGDMQASKKSKGGGMKKHHSMKKKSSKSGGM